MLMYYFVWGFVLLGNYAVNSAPQLLERQQIPHTVADDALESEAAKIVGDLEHTVVQHNDSLEVSPEHFQERNNDSNITPSILIDSENDSVFLTKLISEELQNQTELPFRRDEKDNLNTHNFSKQEQNEEENKSIPKEMEVDVFIRDEDSNKHRVAPYFTDYPAEIYDGGSQLLKSSSVLGEIEESDNLEVKPDTLNKTERPSEENENPESSESTSTIKPDFQEEKEHQIISNISLKNNVEYDKKDENTASDSLHLKASFNEDQSVNPYAIVSTKGTETDFVSTTETMSSSVNDSETSIDGIFLNNSYETASDNDAFSPVLHNYTNSENQHTPENHIYFGNNISDVTSLPVGKSDYSSEQETEMIPTLRTTLSKPISENESQEIEGFSVITQSSPLQKISTLSNEGTVTNVFVTDTPKHSEEKNSVFNEYRDDVYISGDNADAVAAVQFLHSHDKVSSEQCFKLVSAHWDYATNLTEENKNKQLKQTFEYSQFHKESWKNATSFAWKSFNDTLLRRWFKSLSILGNSALPEEKLKEFNSLKADMKNIYSTAKICSYIPGLNESLVPERKCNLSLEPDITRILIKSRDYNELRYVWKAWRDSAGKPIKEKYLRMVELSNEAARLNGFADAGDLWREAYESKTFEEDLDHLWDQLRPLYENLHAYVRRKLIQQYGTDKIREDGPIPAHLFGNMWAQSWVSLLDITQPFPGKPSVDVTPTMEAKNMSVLEMFKISEEFFTSLGLKPMPDEFWKHSVIEKPEDREIVCHASAWDFCNGKDYRIKQCTDKTMEDLITVHHEMGHIQYFLQYSRQPAVFREGANPGFHEAIGDVLALSVSTPKHLKSIGLLEDVADDPEGDLNFLLRTALDKISFIPSGYLIDLWRWRLFSGEINPEQMNTEWWKLRLKYQGICPPVKRTEEDFDPGSKYHVPGNVPYIRYFVSFVIQFQFHKVLCDAAGHTGPLYKCDIYRSKQAGQIFSQVMELGSSEHWSEAMKIMTGGATTKMDAQPIMEYFQPLLSWLKDQNRNETLGWKSDDATFCP